MAAAAGGRDHGAQLANARIERDGHGARLADASTARQPVRRRGHGAAASAGGPGHGSAARLLLARES